jgi:histidine triad (HIT) family protein
MEPSIFTKIINGEIPCHKVYEDVKTFAFLDIHPITDGHVLVIPKKQVEFVWDLNEEDYQALMATTKKIALRLREVLPYQYVAERVIGVDVPHAHVHLLPFNKVSELQAKQRFDEQADGSNLADLAAKIAF